jgi:hypothetical protein
MHVAILVIAEGNHIFVGLSVYGIALYSENMVECTAPLKSEGKVPDLFKKK